MSTYLEDHPPARAQYRSVRRAKVTGAIVVHTAENATDTDLPDGGAEAVARFISRRTDTAGSYHSVVDSDSIVRVGRYEWEMFHEGTGGNRWSLGLSFACKAGQWPVLPRRWYTGALRNGGKEAVNMARWVSQTVGVDIPARRITPAEYRAGQPGFIGHGELDPGRRSDPGLHFPWNDFLAYYRGATLSDTTNPYEAETNEALRLLAEHGDYVGAIDGWFGPKALAALHTLKNKTHSFDIGQVRAALTESAALLQIARGELG
jgi:hypothetical protein